MIRPCFAVRLNRDGEDESGILSEGLARERMVLQDFQNERFKIILECGVIARVNAKDRHSFLPLSREARVQAFAISPFAARA